MPVTAPSARLTGSATTRRPRPRAAGQLDRRSAVSTSERGLAPDSDSSTRNRSTPATSGRQKKKLTARIMMIIVTMPSTTWPSWPRASATPT